MVPFQKGNYMGISKNKGTPKWMVYNGKPYYNGWFGGTTIFGNIHIVFPTSNYHFSGTSYVELRGCKDIVTSPEQLPLFFHSDGSAENYPKNERNKNSGDTPIFHFHDCGRQSNRKLIGFPKESSFSQGAHFIGSVLSFFGELRETFWVIPVLRLSFNEVRWGHISCNLK